MFKGLVLYRKKALDAFVLQNLYHFFVFDEVAELTFLREFSLFNLHSLRVDVFE